MKPLILESHFTGTSNLDTVMGEIGDPVLRLRAFEKEKAASSVCSRRFRIIDSDVFGSLHYGDADIIIGAPPTFLYTCRCSGAAKGLSLEWLASLRRVRQVMPCFVFYECTVHAPWDRVRARLSQWGYVCALATVRAYDVGAPHRHMRTYLLGCLEPLNVKQPFYKRNPYTLVPSSRR